MPRYKLFLLERPAGDVRTIQRATWELPSALDVSKLTKALKGEIEVDWLEIAASDKKREILKIEHELAKHGCMLALDDAGGSLTKDLTDAVRQALSREGRRQSRERARAATIWERGESWRAIPVAVARHARAIASALAALAVLGGSIVLLAVWMNGAPRAGGGRGADASALERLAALSRGDANLPAIPESADGAGGAAEPGEPVVRGGARPLPSADPGGGQPAIPDVPSAGAAATSGIARSPEASARTSNDTRAIEIAGFALGIGWAALVELVARRGTRRSGSRSRAVLTRLVPATLAGALTVGALVALDARTAPSARAPTKREAASPAAQPAAARPRPARAAAERRAAPKPAAKPVAPSYEALMAALAPAPDPCAEAGGALARFLCLERSRHPTAEAGGEPEGAAETAAEPEAAVAPATKPRRTREGEAAPAAATSTTAATTPVSTRAAAAPAQPAAPGPGAPGPTHGVPTSGTAAVLPLPTAPSVSTSGAARGQLPRAQDAQPPLPPPTAKPALPPPAPAPAARRDLLAALPTFLLGLLAGTLGLAIVAVGGSGRGKESAP